MKKLNEAGKSTGGSLPSEALISRLYPELKLLAAARMRNERIGHTLTATALVSEVYCRLKGEGHGWASDEQFFSAAGIAMQRILIDHAKRRNTKKRGGGVWLLRIDDVDVAIKCDPGMILDLQKGIGRLEADFAKEYEVFNLRYFAGLSFEEIGAAIGVGRHVASDRYEHARKILQYLVCGRDSEVSPEET